MSVEVRALSHNLDGGVINDGVSMATIQPLVAQAGSYRPDFLFLQEVTQSQLAHLATALPDYEQHYTPMHGWSGQTKGQVLASRRGLADIVDTPLGYTDGAKRFHLSHATSELSDGTRVRIFNTHLRAFDTAQAKLGRRRQAQMVAAVMAPYCDSSWTVVGGGDYNDGPLFDPLDHMYAPGGVGDFYECDQGDQSNNGSRDGDSTVKDRDSKVDYIWFSRRATPVAYISGGVVVNPYSGHLILRGQAHMYAPPALY